MDTQLKISTDQQNIGPVCDFTHSWCLNCGLSTSAANHFTIAVSELITDIILFAYPNNNHNHFDVIFQHSDSNVELIVKEVGEPFDPDQHQYDPQDALQNGNFEGAGFRLMSTYCDEFLFINKGKEGKEFRLSKNLEDIAHPIDNLLEQSALKQLDIPDEESKSTKQLKSFSVNPIKPSDAEDIAKVIYRSYDYTYSKEDLYFPKRIEEAVSGKKRLGVIARNSKGVAIGYFAVIKKANANIAEIGEAVVSPDYRRQGVMSRMMQHLIEISRQEHLDALFGTAVTNHPVSQKVNAKFGFKTTALMLADTSNVVYKGFDEEYPQPVSVVIDFLPISKIDPKPVYLPEPYNDILQQTYAKLDLSIIPKKADSYTLAERSDIKLDIDYSRFTSHILVNKFGNDFTSVISDMLNSLTEHNLNVVYLDLPLENPATPSQLTKIGGLGFIYSGLAPQFYHGSDFLRLQKVYTPLDFSLIEVHSEFGKKIKSLVDEGYHQNR